MYKKLMLITLLFALMISFIGAQQVNDSSYKPFRAYLEKNGYEVTWNSYLSVAVATKGDREIRIKLNSNKYVSNGILLDLSKPLSVKSGTIYLDKKDMDLFLNSEFDSSKLLSTSYKEYRDLLTFYETDDVILYGGDRGGVDFAEAKESMEFATDESAGAVPEENAEHSDTNNQEEGVDEADLVKVDGKYIYIVRNNELKIVKPSEEMKVLHSIEFSDFSPNNLFVTDDKLVLLGQSLRVIKDIAEEDKKIVADVMLEDKMSIQVYDISNIDTAEPELLKKYYVSGNINQARCIDNYVYIVASEYGYYPMPVFGIGIMEDQVVRDSEAVEGESGTSSFSEILSIVFSLGDSEAVDKVSELEKMPEFDVNYLPNMLNSELFYTVGIDLNNLTKEGIDVNAYAGSPSLVYVSQNNLYVVSYVFGEYSYRATTNISRYSLNEGKVKFEASGKVDGEIHNQFSLGEHNANLRVVTTDYGEDGLSYNNLYVLDPTLKVIGSVTGLAKDERVYSTRMVGEKVYIVTFKETDPFFVVDTSNPLKPEVLGYLKLPGFSEYMHPYDENTIIGIGNDTHQEKNGRVIVDGIKVALFDVSNVSNPVLKSQVVKGVSGSYSDLAYDHKAFMLAKNKNILAFPFSSFDKNGEFTQVASVFHIDSESVESKGDITHREYTKNKYYDNKTNISRIFYIDDMLYTLSDGYLMKSNISDLKTVDVLNLDE